MHVDSAIPTLPSDLLHAISAPGGGHVVLVLGAGCSNEEPTSLPLSGGLSEECHRQLVADGILNEGEVADKRDLSAVAEAVVGKTQSQRDLVDRFPPDAFRHAKPNDGYLIMAALLLEGALADTLTLNFDFAPRTALGQLGAGARVSTVKGPEDHTQLGTRNLIYLHRDIDSDPDSIILRTTALEVAWHEGWRQVITQRVLAGPVTVFVGLGIPASVLVDTTKRILAAIDGNSRVYVVDPIAYEDSSFASALGITSEAYLRMGWGDFMQALSRRVAAEHRAAIEQDCLALISENNYQDEDVADLCRRLTEIGLVRLGQLRAAWMLETSRYLPHEPGISLRLFSALVLGVRMVERLSDCQASFVEDGLVEFCQDTRITRALVCSGRGSMGYARIEAELSGRRKQLLNQGKAISVALVGGVDSARDIATPMNIVADAHPYDLVTGPTHLRIVNIANLRADATLISELIR